MSPKTEEAAAKLRAIRAEIEKEAWKLLSVATIIAGNISLDHTDFGVMAALLRASEIAKKELAEALIEEFV